MTKQLIIGDIHLKKSSISVVSEVLEKCKRLATKVDLTVFMGDVNDTKANIRSETISLLLEVLPDWPTPVVVLVGNHDYNNSIECKGHSLEFLKMLDNVTVIDKPTFTADNDKCQLYVPYMPEDKFIEFIQSVTPRLYAPLGLIDVYCHQDLDFAKYSSGQPTHSAIQADMLQDFNNVFIGHIHLAQEFKNIIYVGTPYTESFKESDEEKTVIYYDNIKDVKKRLPLNVRQHVTHNYQIDSVKQMKDIAKDLKEKIKDNQLVRVLVECPEEIEPKIKRSLLRGLQIEQFKTIAIINHDKTINVTDTMSNIEIMETYLNQLDLTREVLYDVLTTNGQIFKKLEGA